MATYTVQCPKGSGHANGRVTINGTNVATSGDAIGTEKDTKTLKFYCTLCGNEHVLLTLDLPATGSSSTTQHGNGLVYSSSTTNKINRG